MPSPESEELLNELADKVEAEELEIGQALLLVLEVALADPKNQQAINEIDTH